MIPINRNPGISIIWTVTIGKIMPDGKTGHTDIETLPDSDGTRMIISSSPDKNGVYIQPLDKELKDRTFTVTKPPRPVDNNGIDRGSKDVLGKHYDYGQIIRINNPDEFTCTEVTCEISNYIILIIFMMLESTEHIA